MKSIISLALIIISGSAFSQVIIGNNSGTATDKTSVLLEFANDGNKGIILPYVITKSLTPTEGTIILDASTSSTARVKYYNGVSTLTAPDGWQDLSGQDADITSALVDQPTTVLETTDAKVIVGAETSTADGVLILESTTKAMVLPTVTDVNNIPSPSPGMMVYVNKTGAKRLAVFNGSKWSFWKP